MARRLTHVAILSVSTLIWTICLFVFISPRPDETSLPYGDVGEVSALPEAASASHVPNSTIFTTPSPSETSPKLFSPPSPYQSPRITLYHTQTQPQAFPPSPTLPSAQSPQLSPTSVLPNVSNITPTPSSIPSEHVSNISLPENGTKGAVRVLDPKDVEGSQIPPFLQQATKQSEQAIFPVPPVRTPYPIIKAVKDEPVYIVMAVAHPDAHRSLVVCQSVLRNTDKPHLIRFVFVTPPSEVSDMKECIRNHCGNSTVVSMWAAHLNRLSGPLISNQLEKYKPFLLVPMYLAQLAPVLDKVIFLEDDTVVLGNIRDLWAVPLGKNDYAACVPSAEAHTTIIRSSASVPALNISAPFFRNFTHPNVSLFNTGVFVANLEAWRRDNLTRRFERWIQWNAMFKMFTGLVQGPVNIVVAPRCLPVDASWHVRVNPRVKTNSTRPGAVPANIVHFLGGVPHVPLGIDRNGSDWESVYRRFVPRVSCAFKCKDSLRYPDSLKSAACNTFTVDENWRTKWLQGFSHVRDAVFPEALDSPLKPGVKSESVDHVHIALAFSVKHSVGAYTLCQSILQNSAYPSLIRFHLITLAADTPRVLKCSKFYCGPETRVLSFDMRYLKAFSNVTILNSFRQDLVHPTNLARFFLPELLDGLNRVIYMDIDMIAMSDIRELWNVTLSQDQWAACVPDKNLHDGHLLVPNAVAALRFTFFNAGIMLVNLAAWRAHQVGAQCLHVMAMNKKHTIFKGVSQGPLNFVIGPKYLPLDPSWNVRFWAPSGQNMTERIREAKILHWSGNVKPWSKSGKVLKGYAIWKTYRVSDPECVDVLPS